MGQKLILNKNRIFLRRILILRVDDLPLLNVLQSWVELMLGPFKRMRYEEAIDWLAKSEDPRALNKEGQPHVFGMDIEEGTLLRNNILHIAPERFMVDSIGEPIILTHFPRPIKAFYMQPDPKDPRVTESADILIPGVGEIVGGSMRYNNPFILC
jgi:asparaginyl-tRNA synthetase